MENKNNEIKKFIKKVENKFEEYFVAYGVSEHKDKCLINIIIDDRNVMNMDKNDLIMKLDNNLKGLLSKTSKKIIAKSILISDINESNIWDLLMKNAVILDVKILSSFINLKLPENFLDVYKKLPDKFKLSDFDRESIKISKKRYHRNTYQNWLKLLKNAGFLKLKDKTYHKIEGHYRKRLISAFE